MLISMDSAFFTQAVKKKNVEKVSKHYEQEKTQHEKPTFRSFNPVSYKDSTG